MVLVLSNAVFLLHLCDIEVANFQSGTLQDIFLGPLVGRFAFSRSQTHLVHLHFDLDMFLALKFGQYTYRLAEYTSVQASRPTPRLKLEPTGGAVRDAQRPITFLEPPDAPARIGVAVLDGGLPQDNPIAPWVDYIKANSTAGCM